jgi:hypothetical protein
VPKRETVNAPVVERCLRAYPDQAELEAFATCNVAHDEQVARCLSACPADASPCQASELGSCPHLTNQENLNACYTAAR